MKKSLIIACAAVSAMFTGCTPTAETVSTTATAIGYAAGVIANQTDIPEPARNATVGILEEIMDCVPASGQSYTDAWSPIIDAKISDLVKAGKIDASASVLVKTVAVMAAQAVDYTFDVRFPKAKEYETLVRAGTTGVIGGFLAVFKSSNVKAVSQTKGDVEAYEYFKKKFGK